MTAMFIDCPYCGFLVATDDEGRPLPRCPNCAQRLREDDDATATPGEATLPAAPESPQPPPTTPPVAEVVIAAAADKATADGIGGPQPAVPETAQSPSAPATTVEANAPTPALAGPRLAATDNGEANVGHGVAAGAATAGDDGETAPVMAAVAEDATEAPATSAEDDDAASADASEQPEPPSAVAEDERAANKHGDGETIAAPTRHDTPADDAIEALPDAATVPEASTSEIAVEGDAAVAVGDADADVIAELMQREMPVEAEIAPPETAGAPTTAADIAAATPVVLADMPAAAPSPARARKSAQRRATPSFVRTAQAPAPVDRRRLLLRCGAIAALSLLLALQLMLSERARLAADAGWRPLLASLCGVLQCSLPPWREPTAFELLERDVRAHPSLPGVLRVSARFRNDARWPQPWPAMQLTLSDVNGRSVATRVFQPREYLGDSPTQSELGSGQAAAVALDVIEPGTQAVAFTFDFQ